MISSLKPNVTRDEALRILDPQGLSRWWRSLCGTRLHSIADIYVPFRLYRINVRNAGKPPQEQLLALDAVRGTFDLYSFDAAPVPGQMIEVSSRNHPPVMLSGQQSVGIIIERVRRLVFTSGFFKIRDLSIEAEPASASQSGDSLFHVPYWVGMFGSPNDLRIAAIDAVRRRMEGNKVRSFFREWLAS